MSLPRGATSEPEHHSHGDMRNVQALERRLARFQGLRRIGPSDAGWPAPARFGRLGGANAQIVSGRDTRAMMCVKRRNCTHEVVKVQTTRGRTTTNWSRIIRAAIANRFERECACHFVFPSRFFAPACCRYGNSYAEKCETVGPKCDDCSKAEKTGLDRGFCVCDTALGAARLKDGQ